jgi:hypothetical protein
LVIDGAKNLKQAGFDRNRASPLTIMLISKVFGFKVDCLERTQQEAAILDIPIPESVKKKTGYSNSHIKSSS